MNKTELVAAIASQTGLTKKDTQNTVDVFMSVVENALKKGDTVQLIGFGTFGTTKRKARTGKNPATGEAIKIPAAVVPKFRAGASLKAAVDKKKASKPAKKK